MFEAKLDQYTGPLDKLLELIEEKKLEITSLSLSTVTLDFLNYLKEQGGSVAPDLLSDFLVIAAKLVLIKSKTLIPELELDTDEEADIRDLETRLKLYREFSARSGGKARALAEAWRASRIMVSRPFLVGFAESGQFYPGEHLTLSALTGARERIIKNLREFLPEVKKVQSIIIKLEDKVQELMERCAKAVEHAFSTLAKDRPRAEIVVLFLAILHLLKAKTISVRQGEPFSDIILKRI
jgi:segregation and condensation protein A